MAKNWLQQLNKYEDVVDRSYDPHKHVVRCASPSINFMFGKGHGLPFGLTAAIGGPPKGGKTVLCKSFTGQLHRDYPDALAVKFNTEFREQAQATPEEDQYMWGIDPDRFRSYETNNPIEIFDRIDTDFAALCQEGMPLKLIIIDSITGIQGRRDMNATTVETQQIGDLALTLQTGLKRILPVIRKHKIALILTCHIRAEMDQLEQKRGNKVRMAMPLGVEHVAEYKIFIEPNRNVEGRKNLAGEEFKDASLKDLGDNSEQTGHKIKARMKDSSCGPKGRLGEFTIDYRKGHIDIHEEVFLLGCARGVINRPNNVTYQFGDQDFRGKPAILEALRNSDVMQAAIVDEIRKRDQAGAYDNLEVEAASEDE